MENATKALLIAGAVLIAIILIAVGIKILSSTQGVTEQVDNVSSAMEVSIFNSQFTKYEGRQNHTAVKQLINTIIINNERDYTNRIIIDLEDYNRGGGDTYDTYLYQGDLNTVRNWAATCGNGFYAYFDVDFGFDLNGRIIRVNIHGYDL